LWRPGLSRIRHAQDAEIQPRSCGEADCTCGVARPAARGRQLTAIVNSRFDGSRRGPAGSTRSRCGPVNAWSTPGERRGIAGCHARGVEPRPEAASRRAQTDPASAALLSAALGLSPETPGSGWEAEQIPSQPHPDFPSYSSCLLLKIPGEFPVLNRY